MSPNVLSQRLSDLESTSAVRQRKLLPLASVYVYKLTEWGAELEPVIMALEGTLTCHAFELADECHFSYRGASNQARPRIRL